MRAVRERQGAQCLLVITPALVGRRFGLAHPQRGPTAVRALGVLSALRASTAEAHRMYGNALVIR
jgi:hypothetical protein